MPMDIRSALDRIVVVQKSLVITQPIPAKILRAYKTIPSQATLAPDAPCFINSVIAFHEERLPSGGRTQHYTVRMQLLVEDADDDRAADIALAFHGALVNAFDTDVNQGLNGACTVQTLRSASVLLGVIDRGNRKYIGTDVLMEIVMSDARPLT
jgi:hypothetical protein